MKKITILILFLTTVNCIGICQWFQSSWPSGAYHIDQFQWINKDTAFATFETTSGIKLYNTYNQGSSWNYLSTPNCRLMYFFDFKTGYFKMGNDSFYRTFDGGKTFTAVGNTSPITSNLNCMYFITPNRGLLIGGNEEAALSVDGGKNWNTLPLAPLFLSAGRYPSFPDSLHGFCYGDISHHSGKDSIKIFVTIDGGKTWSAKLGFVKNHGSGGVFPSNIQFVSQNIGFADLYKTIDGGSTWFYAGNGLDTSFTVSSFNYIDSMVGYAVIGNTSKIYKTYDGGRHWNLQATFPGKLGGSPDVITFADHNIGAIYVCSSSSNTILITDNGGHSTAIKTPEANKAEFSLYPNPAKDLVNISATGLSPGPALLTVRDIFGRAVYTEQINAGESLETTIDLSQYKPGMYFIAFSDNNMNMVKKIMIER